MDSGPESLVCGSLGLTLKVKIMQTQNKGYKWGSTAMQGWRTNMEDSHIHQVRGFKFKRCY